MNVVQWAFSMDLQKDVVANGIDGNEAPVIVLPVSTV